MRKMFRSRKTEPITSLMAAALSPSLPIGFSTMMRERGVHKAFRAEALRQRTEQVRTRREIISADAFVGAKQRLKVCPSAVRS